MRQLAGVLPVTWDDFSVVTRRYWQLTKPTITMLVVVTTLPGILLAAPQLPTLELVFWVFVGTALSSASAAAFNQAIDFSIDSKMTRTRARPLPRGTVSLSASVIFASVLGVAGALILGFKTHWLAAVVAVAANAFYVLVYTSWLKKLTVQNIVIGGAAGAVGPMIGWAAVTGTLSWESFLLFALVFLWTPPHFWALALKYKDDYARANVPMLPVVKGDETTRRQMFWYSLTLTPVILGLYLLGSMHVLTLILCMGLTGYFVFLCLRLLSTKDNTLAMPVFHYSCLYLFLIFGLIGLDRFLVIM